MKNKYAVSILSIVSPDTVLNELHKYKAEKYTNSMVEDALPDKLIYSFVCDNQLLNKILNTYNCELVISPRSIEEKLNIDTVKSIYIDENY